MFYYHRIPVKLKGEFHSIAIRPIMYYGTEYWAARKHYVHKMSMAEMKILRYMYGNVRKDRIRNEVIINLSIEGSDQEREINFLVLHIKYNSL